MMMSRKITVIIAALALGYSSCATLIYGPGPQQTVSISTNPPGATVRVGNQQVVSPAQLSLDRYTGYEVVATKPGYNTATATIDSAYSWATVVDLIFIAPWLVDMVSNSVYSLSPDNMNLVLEPMAVANAADTK
jgi:PEGA domain